MFISAILLLIVIYVGSYFALADHGQRSPWLKKPHFRVGGETAVYFYTPLLYVDLLMRPGYWFDRALHDAAMQRQQDEIRARQMARQQKLSAP